MNGWILLMFWVLFTSIAGVRIDEHLGVELPKEGWKQVVHKLVWELTGIGVAYIMWFEIMGATLPK